MRFVPGLPSTKQQQQQRTWGVKSRQGQTCIWRACLLARSLLMDDISSSAPSPLDSIVDMVGTEAAEGGEIQVLPHASGTASTSYAPTLSNSASSIVSSGRPVTFAFICLPPMLIHFAPRIMLFLGHFWSDSLRCEVCEESIGRLVRHDGIWRWYCTDCFLLLRQSGLEAGSLVAGGRRRVSTYSAREEEPGAGVCQHIQL